MMNDFLPPWIRNIDPLYLTGLIVSFVALILMIVLAFPVGGGGSNVDTFQSILPGATQHSNSSSIFAWFGMALFFLLLGTLVYHLATKRTEPSSSSSVERAPAAAAPLLGKQVFHIPGNAFTFEDAKAICKAYNADLATYDQMEQAYNQGAEWCTYGWSADQLALFPTQKKTFAALQKTPGKEHACGRPGINGGYVPSPTTKYGVNCYGKRPPMRPAEKHMMDTMTTVPRTKEEEEFQRQVEYWQARIHTLVVAPFNADSWGTF